MMRFDIDEASEFFIGEDKLLTFTIYQQDKRTVQNLSGWTLSWMLKADLDDADGSALVTKTMSSGITIESPVSAGIVTVRLIDTDTEALTAGKYWHELKRTNEGEETVLSFGRCVLRRGVHRS